MHILYQLLVRVMIFHELLRLVFVFCFVLFRCCCRTNHVGQVGEVSSDVLSFLSASTEYHLLDVVNDAANFRARGKRSRLTVDDINASLELRGAEVIKSPLCMRDRSFWARRCLFLRRILLSVWGPSAKGSNCGLLSHYSVLGGMRKRLTLCDGFVSVRLTF